jgi:hypothetical protein
MAGSIGLSPTVPALGPALDPRWRGLPSLQSLGAETFCGLLAVTHQHARGVGKAQIIVCRAALKRGRTHDGLT